MPPASFYKLARKEKGKINNNGGVPGRPERVNRLEWRGKPEAGDGLGFGGREAVEIRRSWKEEEEEGGGGGDDDDDLSQTASQTEGLNNCVLKPTASIHARCPAVPVSLGQVKLRRLETRAAVCGYPRYPNPEDT